MSTVAASRKIPAFRINDVVTVERRRYRVGHIGLISRIPRSRLVTSRPDPLLEFTLWPVSGRGSSKTVRFEQTDLVSTSTTNGFARWAR